MKLSELLLPLTGCWHSNTIDQTSIEIDALCDDSRQVTTNDLFVAIRGLNTDGHQHLLQAQQRGAIAAVVETAIDTVDIPQFIVTDSSYALGILAATIQNNPSQELTLIGITGTNGKTTCAFIIDSLLNHANKASAMIGTLGCYIKQQKETLSPYTTPTPIVLHQTLRDIVTRGCTHVVMEVSSAALSMNRLAGIEFDVALFTNLTQDHLDLHGSMENYGNAKRLLFRDHLKKNGTAIAIIDDNYGNTMLNEIDQNTIRISTHHKNADVFVRQSQSSLQGINLSLQTPLGIVSCQTSMLIGAHNISNIATAISACQALTLTTKTIQQGIQNLSCIPGRLQPVPNDRHLSIFIDYAHTPDALQQCLTTLRPLIQGRLICVFGCGGDRDQSKRALMGKTVSDLADVVVVTSDNPRNENPNEIIDMITSGMSKTPFYSHPDRSIAIGKALAIATDKDLVLIAGKGHEQYQIQNEQTIYFSDYHEAQAAIARQTTTQWIVHATGGSLSKTNDKNNIYSRIVIDGRTTSDNSLYVAIKGTHFDGHQFCTQAATQGAKGVVINKGAINPSEIDSSIVDIIEVPDTQKALGSLAQTFAQDWMSNSDKHMIGITGSSGKTTTKDFLAAALSAYAPTLKNQGSFNNETGVPLTLLELKPFHRYAVIEMAMRGLNHIAYLAQLAQPDIGVITNLGNAHIGVVGSEQAIIRGKAELFESISSSGHVILPFTEKKRLAPFITNNQNQLTFGTDSNADICIKQYDLTQNRLEISVCQTLISLQLPLLGKHNAFNAAAALAAAYACGVPPETAAKGLETAQITPLRNQIITKHDRTIIADCYNANPGSMKAAVDMFSQITPLQKRVAILGDMLELGTDAQQEHQRLGIHLAQFPITLIAMGEHKSDMAQACIEHGGHALIADSIEQAATLALQETQPNDWILLKGSRTMKLERIIIALETLSHS